MVLRTETPGKEAYSLLGKTLDYVAAQATSVERMEKLSAELGD